MWTLFPFDEFLSVRKRPAFPFSGLFAILTQAQHHYRNITVGALVTMKRKSKARKTTLEDASQQVPTVYCTECGTTLENFCFDRTAEDLQAIRKTLAQCKKQGRFSGEFCSKLFIAHPGLFPDLGENIEDDLT